MSIPHSASIEFDRCPHTLTPNPGLTRYLSTSNRGRRSPPPCSASPKRPRLYEILRSFTARRKPQGEDEKSGPQSPRKKGQALGVFATLRHSRQTSHEETLSSPCPTTEGRTSPSKRDKYGHEVSLSPRRRKSIGDILGNLSHKASSMCNSILQNSSDISEPLSNLTMNRSTYHETQGVRDSMLDAALNGGATRNISTQPTGPTFSEIEGQIESIKGVFDALQYKHTEETLTSHHKPEFTRSGNIQTVITLQDAPRSISLVGDEELRIEAPGASTGAFIEHNCGFVDPRCTVSNQMRSSPAPNLYLLKSTRNATPDAAVCLNPARMPDQASVFEERLIDEEVKPIVARMTKNLTTLDNDGSQTNSGKQEMEAWDVISLGDDILHQIWLDTAMSRDIKANNYKNHTHHGTRSIPSDHKNADTKAPKRTIPLATPFPSQVGHPLPQTFLRAANVEGAAGADAQVESQAMSKDNIGSTQNRHRALGIEQRKIHGKQSRRPCSNKARHVSVAPVFIDFPGDDDQPPQRKRYNCKSDAISDLYSQSEGCQYSNFCTYDPKDRTIQVCPRSAGAPNISELRAKGQEIIWLPMNNNFNFVQDLESELWVKNTKEGITSTCSSGGHQIEQEHLDIIQGRTGFKARLEGSVRSNKINLSDNTGAPVIKSVFDHPSFLGVSPLTTETLNSDSDLINPAAQTAQQTVGTNLLAGSEIVRDTDIRCVGSQFSRSKVSLSDNESIDYDLMGPSTEDDLLFDLEGVEVSSHAHTWFDPAKDCITKHTEEPSGDLIGSSKGAGEIPNNGLRGAADEPVFSVSNNPQGDQPLRCLAQQSSGYGPALESIEGTTREELSPRPGPTFSYIKYLTAEDLSSSPFEGDSDGEVTIVPSLLQSSSLASILEEGPTFEHIEDISEVISASEAKVGSNIQTTSISASPSSGHSEGEVDPGVGIYGRCCRLSQSRKRIQVELAQSHANQRQSKSPNGSGGENHTHQTPASGIPECSNKKIKFNSGRHISYDEERAPDLGVVEPFLGAPSETTLNDANARPVVKSTPYSQPKKQGHRETVDVANISRRCDSKTRILEPVLNRTQGPLASRAHNMVRIRTPPDSPYRQPRSVRVMSSDVRQNSTGKFPSQHPSPLLRPLSVLSDIDMEISSSFGEVLERSCKYKDGGNEGMPRSSPLQAITNR